VDRGQRNLGAGRQGLGGVAPDFYAYPGALASTPIQPGLIGASRALPVASVVLVWSVLSSSRRSYEVRARDMAEALAAVAQLNIGSELSQVDAVLRSPLHDLVPPGLPEQAGDQGLHPPMPTRPGFRTRNSCAKGPTSGTSSGQTAWSSEPTTSGPAN